MFLNANKLPLERQRAPSDNQPGEFLRHETEIWGIARNTLCANHDQAERDSQTQKQSQQTELLSTC